MKLMRFAASVAAVAVMAFASSAQAQGTVELGANNGFESSILSTDPFLPGAAQDWYSFTGPGATGVGTATVDPFAGASHADIVIAGAGNSFAGIQQPIAAVPGDSYTFSFYAQDAPGTFDVGIEYRIEWRDAGGGEISRDQLTATSFGNGYSLFSVSGVAPAGTANLNAVIALQSFQGGTTGTVNIDNTSILGPATAVPEPSSLALLGLATFGMVARRRRS